MRDDFKRLGVLGDWDEPYLTMNYGYQAAIVRALGRFVEQGLVYKGKKPVHWCTHCRTALAEAEVEYEDHTSPSIYVEFPLAPSAAGDLAARIPALAGRDVSVLIWTTTPWTIPSNLAVAFHPDFDYGAYEFDGRVVILASELAETVGKATGKPLGDPILVVKGEVFDRLAFQHPLYDRPSLGVLADYVTLEAGTGVVHTAPGHGSDDYATGVRYGLDVYAPVGPGGHYTDDVLLFAGLQVWAANPKVEEALHERARALASRGVRPQLSALLALPQPGDLPGHVAVVHRHGSRVRGRRRPHPAGAVARGDPGRAVDPGAGARSASTTCSPTARTGASRASGRGACRSRPSPARPASTCC